MCYVWDYVWCFAYVKDSIDEVYFVCQILCNIIGQSHFIICTLLHKTSVRFGNAYNKNEFYCKHRENTISNSTFYNKHKYLMQFFSLHLNGVISHEMKTALQIVFHKKI